MFTTTNESVFFLAEIDKTKKVLEYGSGQSTFEIADKCLNIISIEHQEDWYNKEGGHCGTYEEFKSYIEAPLDKGPFDVILIDGRARVSCASVVKLMSHDNTIIFIHDFNRPEYQDALNFLELVEQVGTMAKFKLKK